MVRHILIVGALITILDLLLHGLFVEIGPIANFTLNFPLQTTFVVLEELICDVFARIVRIKQLVVFVKLQQIGHLMQNSESNKVVRVHRIVASYCISQRFKILAHLREFDLDRKSEKARRTIVLYLAKEQSFHDFLLLLQVNLCLFYF